MKYGNLNDSLAVMENRPHTILHNLQNYRLDNKCFSLSNVTIEERIFTKHITHMV